MIVRKFELQINYYYIIVITYSNKNGTPLFPLYTYTEEAEIGPVYPVGPNGYNSTAPHNGIILHITESDDKLFPETHIEIQKEIKETRKVYLNNA